jgi:hypothetical protein
VGRKWRGGVLRWAGTSRPVLGGRVAVCRGKTDRTSPLQSVQPALMRSASTLRAIPPIPPW